MKINWFKLFNIYLKDVSEAIQNDYYKLLNTGSMWRDTLTWKSKRLLRNFPVYMFKTFTTLYFLHKKKNEESLEIQNVFFGLLVKMRTRSQTDEIMARSCIHFLNMTLIHK